MDFETWYERYFCAGHDVHDRLSRHAAQVAWNAAVAAERERCAVLAEVAASRAWGGPVGACHGVAKIIRTGDNE
jgi:hypothetical protein